MSVVPLLKDLYPPGAKELSGIGYVLMADPDVSEIFHPVIVIISDPLLYSSINSVFSWDPSGFGETSFITMSEFAAKTLFGKIKSSKKIQDKINFFTLTSYILNLKSATSWGRCGDTSLLGHRHVLPLHSLKGHNYSRRNYLHKVFRNGLS